jgi:hypothetical protein
VQEWLEDVASFADSYDAGGSGVIDTIMEVVDSARVYDLFPADVRADELAHAQAKLCHGAVVLRPSEEPHVGVGKLLRHRQPFAVWPHKRPCKIFNSRK